jgi:Pentapeptide repeats (9 copies)
MMEKLAEQSGPFTSLRALRAASDELVQNLPEDEALISDRDAANWTKRITAFIDQCAVTGKVLDAPADRRAAQNLVDFWVTKRATLVRDSGSRGRRAERPSVSVERFDPASIDAAAKQGDEMVGSLGARGKRLVRRILFQLLRLPDSGDDFGSEPRNRDELLRLGRTSQVEKLLGQLRAAGIITSDDQGKIALSYLALTRRWKWLTDEITKRMNFRALALSWIRSDRSWGALLSWSLTRRYRREYSNFNDWEQEFLTTSGRLGGVKLVGGVLGALLIAVTAFFSSSFYEKWWAPARTPSITQEILAAGTPPVTKIEDLKWLAQYHQKIELTGIDLNTPDEKDLSKIYGSSAVFRNAKLRAVKFDGAALIGASFSGSTISQSSFKGAFLNRANFDIVRLCEDSDFTDADVREASFRRATFFREHIPKFEGSPWWLASGWGFEQISLLDGAYPASRITDSRIFKRDVSFIDTILKGETNPYRKADLLNQKAWMLAIYGVVSDGAAEAAVREALQLLEDPERKSSRSRTYAWSQDTLAYILLQEKDTAKQQASLQEALGLLAQAETIGAGEVYFRYAVALHRAHKESDATERLENAIREKEYDPSHELYLLNEYFTGPFKNEVMNLTRSPLWAPPKGCPEIKP